MKWKTFKKIVKEIEKETGVKIAIPTGQKKVWKSLTEEEKENILNNLLSMAEFKAALNSNVEENVTEESDTKETLNDSIEDTLEQRGRNYGDFKEHAALSQKLKILFDEHVMEHGNPELFHYAMNEAIEMIFHKVARIANGDPTYADSWHDIAGYATLVEKELTKQ